MYSIKIASDPNIKEESVTGFLGGLNTFQDETLIKDSELTEAKNILLSVDGIEPRQGTQNYGEPLDDRVVGGIGYYRSTGEREFLRVSNGVLQKYIDGIPTAVAGKNYDPSSRMNMIQVRDRIYTFNGVDNLTMYDGTTITEWERIETPTGLTVTVQGATGDRDYSYRVSAFNDVGETVASEPVGVDNGNRSLNASNYNRLAWNQVPGATGYNIYGRHATGLGELLITTVYNVTTFDDNGQFAYDPDLGMDIGQTTLPPEDNSTGGIIGSMTCFWQGRIYVAGIPGHPSRLAFGGVGENIGNFSLSSVGGGYIDISLNDGSIIRGILPFQNGIIIWKDNAIYKFSFSTLTGSAMLEEITRAFGGIAIRGARHVENDVIFPAKKDGRITFFSLGNQEGYMSSVLRTNELSIKIAPNLKDVNMGELENACAFYFNNLYMCAIPTRNSSINNRVWKLDTRFGAWTYDEGYTPNFYMDYVDDEGNQNCYFGDEKSGYMVENFISSNRNDNGVPFDVRLATKAFTQKSFWTDKTYYDSKLQFKDISSESMINGEIILDGNIRGGQFMIDRSISQGVGFGNYLFGGTLFGDAEGGATTAATRNTIIELFMKNESTSIKYGIYSKSSNPKFKLLSIAHLYQIMPDKRIDSNNRVYIR